MHSILRWSLSHTHLGDAKRSQRAAGQALLQALHGCTPPHLASPQGGRCLTTEAGACSVPWPVVLLLPPPGSDHPSLCSPRGIREVEHLRSVLNTKVPDSLPALAEVASRKLREGRCLQGGTCVLLVLRQLCGSQAPRRGHSVHSSSCLIPGPASSHLVTLGNSYDLSEPCFPMIKQGIPQPCRGLWRGKAVLRSLIYSTNVC